jgi:long-chain acyl-CoA synthetase
MPLHDAQKPWLASYPPGVPTTIDIDALVPLNHVIETATQRYGGRPAFSSFGKSLGYSDVTGLARQLVSGLQARGLKKGDRIALMMPNIMAYPVSMYACLLGGYIIVNVNPLYTPRELAHQLKDSGARAIIVLENFAKTVMEVLPDVKLDLVAIAKAGDFLGFKGAIVSVVAKYVKKVVPAYTIPGAVVLTTIVGEGKVKAPQPVPISLDDTAFLQYTGGTTGVSKGAELTHRNVAANLEQAWQWLGRAFAEKSDQHVMVTALPLYHIFALTCNAMLMARLGACCLLISNPRDLPAFIKTLKSSRFTLLTGVNTLFNALMNQPDFAKLDFSNLSAAVGGGMSVQSGVAKRWKDMTGTPILEGYGLSETSPILTMNRHDLTDWTGTIGYPAPSTDIVIMDKDGKILPIGEPGEIAAQGPQVMKGYWQRPDETAKVTTPDGYFRTGDVGIMNPDGSIKIVDRIKDMVLVSGFNVYPNEVEDVIAAAPGVAEAAVIGLPDEQTGEKVVAYIVRKGDPVSAEEILAFCKANLTRYKVPKEVHFIEVLPKTNVGKILRRALRDQAISAR